MGVKCFLEQLLLDSLVDLASLVGLTQLVHMLDLIASQAQRIADVPTPLMAADEKHFFVLALMLPFIVTVPPGRIHVKFRLLSKVGVIMDLSLLAVTSRGLGMIRRDVVEFA